MLERKRDRMCWLSRGLLPVATLWCRILSTQKYLVTATLAQDDLPGRQPNELIVISLSRRTVYQVRSWEVRAARSW